MIMQYDYAPVSPNAFNAKYKVLRNKYTTFNPNNCNLTIEHTILERVPPD